jgi:hypothetical protein
MDTSTQTVGEWLINHQNFPDKIGEGQHATGYALNGDGQYVLRIPKNLSPAMRKKLLHTTHLTSVPEILIDAQLGQPLFQLGNHRNPRRNITIHRREPGETLEKVKNDIYEKLDLRALPYGDLTAKATIQIHEPLLQHHERTGENPFTSLFNVATRFAKSNKALELKGDNILLEVKTGKLSLIDQIQNDSRHVRLNPRNSLLS